MGLVCTLQPLHKASGRKRNQPVEKVGKPRQSPYEGALAPQAILLFALVISRPIAAQEVEEASVSVLSLASLQKQGDLLFEPGGNHGSRRHDARNQGEAGSGR